MAPVSQAQRAAMHAAAQGKSTLGIPKKVGKEFSEADPGGKLPKKIKDNDHDRMMERREPPHYPPLAMMSRMMGRR
jgi:hypothetical protein